jgi:hypothetical protein
MLFSLAVHQFEYLNVLQIIINSDLREFFVGFSDIEMLQPQK